jgi:hypothetical protein
MQNKFLNKYSLILLLLTSTFLFIKCGKEEAENTTVEVLSFGPSPALRGGDLRFIGNNLDKVTSVILPENVEVTNFKSKSSEELVIVVPQETVEGEVSVKSAEGTIKMKSRLTISEPIAIVSISPLTVRPGDKITITGTYLNLIREIIFPNRKSVIQFVSKTQDKIEVLVPLDAQTGKIVLSNADVDPILIESETDLTIVQPIITSMSPNPVKPGQNVTIEGTNLDLVTEVIFGGNKPAQSIISKEGTKIVAQVPADAQDGKITIRVASLLEIASTDDLAMVVPIVTKLSPLPAKNGKTITIEGTNLDLVTSIVFPGDKAGTVSSQNASSITVLVPRDALEGSARLNLRSTKSVETASIVLVKPTIANFTPETTRANQEITVSGTHLDLITKIIFAGEKEVVITNTNETQFSVNVPSGTLSGAFTLVTSNGTIIQSGKNLSLLASNVPTVTGFPARAKPGQMIVLTGTKMNLLTDVIFPNNVKASTFGVKTDERIEVIVPLNVKIGRGKIRFVTIDNEFSETDEILFAGVDPVKDASLVFFDFDGKGAWWGRMQGNTRNDNESVDGTKYGYINENLNGWTDVFWRNSANDFPGARIGTNINAYVIKLDINVKETLTGGNLKMRLQGTEGDFWYGLGPDAPNAGNKAFTKTDGWETITLNISDFKDNFGWGTNSPTNLALITDAFGMAWDNGASKVNVLIDNVRFELK